MSALTGSIIAAMAGGLVAADARQLAAVLFAKAIEPGRLLVAAPFGAIGAAAGCASAVAAVRR